MNQTKEEISLRKKFFSAQNELRKFMFDKYAKYSGKPVKLKPNVFPNFEGPRIGFYDHHDMPTFMNHERLHWINLGDQLYYFSEDAFEIYKKKIKDKDGNFIHYVDVKCPHCSHIGIYNMRYLVWKLNCENCRNTITVNDRVKKQKFNMNDFR